MSYEITIEESDSGYYWKVSHDIQMMDGHCFTLWGAKREARKAVKDWKKRLKENTVYREVIE